MSDGKVSNIDLNTIRIDSLEGKIETLGETIEALWEIVKSETNLGDDTLKAMLEERRAYKEEKAKERVSCPQCKQTTTTQHQKCIYCGSELGAAMTDSVFDYGEK